jgi:hypothetical protein
MKKNILLMLISLLTIFALAGCDALIPQGLMGAGVTNLTNLELAGTLDVAGNTDLVGTLNYGANNLYPVGYDTSGEQFLFVTQDLTQSEVIVTTGLATITYALCTLCEDPAAATDAAFCTISITTNVVTGKIWQADGSTASGEANVCVNALIVGTP